MKKTLVIAGVSIVVVQAGLTLLVNSLDRAKAKNEIHDHPYIKGVCWITAKRMSWNFDPDNVDWGNISAK